MSIFPDRSAFRSRFKTCYVLFYCINMFLMPCASATEDLHLLRNSNENELDQTEENGFMIDTPQIVLGTSSLSLVTDERLPEVQSAIPATLSSAGANRMTKPKREDSDLSDEEWDIVEKGTEATDTISSLIEVIPEGDSPQEVMQTFADVCDIIGEFVPAFGFVGQALGIVAGFLPGNDEEPDPMIEYMDARFDFIEGELKKILNRFDEVMLHECFLQWDATHKDYIVDFDSEFDVFSNPENSKDDREEGYHGLFNQCVDHPPRQYINRWKWNIVDETWGKCVPKFLEKSSNRVLYLRRTFTTIVLSNIFRAARYEGICNGIKKQYREDTGTGQEVSIQSASVEGWFRAINDEFESIEDDFYNAPISAWKSSLQDYTNAQTDANVVMNALKDDFFPDHRYAAVLIAKNNDEVDYATAMFFGHGGQEYGSFQLDSKDRKIVVVYFRKRSNRQSLSGLPRFVNCVCGGEEMCKRKEGSCKQSHCYSTWHQVVENSDRNNKNMRNLYASRGTVLVKTVVEEKFCAAIGNCEPWTGTCTCSRYAYRDKSKVSVSYASGNDAIIQSIDTPYEGGLPMDERYQYKLIGIAGDFQCSDSRQCSSNYCGSKCSGTAPTPSVACSGGGNPTCSNNNECKPDYECKSSALYTKSTYLANLLSKGLTQSHLRRAGAFMNDDDCDNGSVAGNFTMSSSKTCKYAPPPPPSPCFSSESQVNVLQEGLVPISEIKVGDYVQSKMDGSFSRVYALEKNHYGESEFYQLLSSSGTILELTNRHMIFLKNSPKPIPARDVKVGDILATDDSSDAVSVSGEVTKIEVIRRNGYYNPLTEDGTIILNNGAVASSFSVARSSSSNFFDKQTEILHWHTLSHLANAPLRVVCKAWFGFCAEEIFQDENGLHKFVVLLKRASNLPKWAQAIVFPFIFGMGVFFTVLELMYDKAKVLLEVASSTGIGVGLLTFSLVAALAVPGLLAFRKRYFL